MSTRPDLVGVVASARAMGTLSILAGATGALPVLLGHTQGMSGAAITTSALLLFGLPFAWFAGPRRTWYRERLEAATPTPPGAVVVSRKDEYRRVTEPLTKAVIVVLVVELFVAFMTGVPIGLALSGIGAGLLSQAHWLARQERRRSVRIVCPLSPGRVAADDPHLSEYRAVPFFTDSGHAPADRPESRAH
ncbi:hypothetical protein [Streptomyces sp. NPDC002599]|uniref:hypothetical protein n=1 Tax=unclassified Streptomyces TaxID=2593676 RepID=UPI00331B2A7B